MFFHAVLLLSMIGLAVDESRHVLDMQVNKTYLERYANFEVKFCLDRDYSNPYDPNIVQVDALIASDEGSAEFPCFYFVPVKFSGTGRRKSAEEMPENACWMLRYSFINDGIYSIRIRVRDESGETFSDPISVTVRGASGKGYIRIHPQDRGVFSFDDGSLYYPNGFNLAWNAGNLADHYAEYTDKMHKYGANWLRYWFVGFARQKLEWDTEIWKPWNQGYGLGKYNQKAAAFADAVVSMAEKKGIYLQLVFEAHGEWSTRVNPNWKHNPYNSEIGGIIESPADFFTDQEAKRLARNRYRYTIARWGYSTAIFAWEFFNEVNFTDAYYPPSDENTESIVRWHEEMAEYVKSLDHAGHLVTTSANSKDLLIALDKGAPSLDQLQFHHYAHSIHEAITKLSGDLLNRIQKPIMAGEFGPSGIDDMENHPDPWGDHVRKTIWLGVFRKVPNMFWFWDYIERYDLYEVYRPLDEFLSGENFAGLETFHLNLDDELGIGTLSLIGTLGWKKTKKQEFVIDPSGKTEGLSGLSRYLQGDYHAEMGDRVSFLIDFKESGKVFMEIQEVSSAGSDDVRILIDGKLAVSRPFSEPGIIETSVPAGLHRISFQNKGDDWVSVSCYGFTGVNAPALRGLGLRSGDKAYGYIYNARDGEWIDPDLAESIRKGRLTISDMKPGKYQLIFTNPRTGQFTDVGQIEVENGSAEIQLPVFSKDIAFKLAYIYP